LAHQIVDVNAQQYHEEGDSLRNGVGTALHQKKLFILIKFNLNKIKNQFLIKSTQ